MHRLEFQALRMRNAERTRVAQERQTLADNAKTFTATLKAGDTVLVRKQKKEQTGEFVRFKKNGVASVKLPNYKNPIDVKLEWLQPAQNEKHPHLQEEITEKTPDANTTDNNTPNTEKNADTSRATENSPRENEPKKTPQSDYCEAGELFCNDTVIETPNEAIPAQYAVYELNKLITSHNPKNFKPREDYPDTCQQRDYTGDKAEQQKVERIAQTLKPHFVISPVPTATDGAPIITKNGVVLGGNGRTMGLKLYAERSDYSQYIRYLRKTAHVFGLDSRDLDRFKYPVLVRVIDAPLTKCALYSNILNTNLTQGIDAQTAAFASARQLERTDLERISAIFDRSESNTFAELVQSKSGAKDIVDLFRKRGIITDRNVSQFLDPKTAMPTAQGRLSIESIVLGSVLREKSLADAAANYTNAIIKALPALLKIQSFTGEWNIMVFVEQAIRLEAERRAANVIKSMFVNQETFHRSSIPEETRIVWDALDAGQMAFKRFAENFVRRAETEMQADNGFGFTQALTATEVLRRMKEHKGLSDNELEQPKTMKQVRKTPVRVYHLSPLFRAFLGVIEQNFSILFWGLPGQGKSSFVLALAQELQRFGEILYISSEESLSKIKSKSDLMRVSSPRISVLTVKSSVLQQVKAYASTGKYRFLVIDSVSDIKLTGDQAKELIAEFPNVNFLFIGHSNKDGKAYSGSKDIGHSVDVIVEVKDGIATTTKNRFAEKGKVFDIFKKR